MNKNKIIATVLACIFALCAIFFGAVAYLQWSDGRQSAETFESLELLIADTATDESQVEDADDENTTVPVNDTNETYLKYLDLYRLNHDFVGWISIEDTNINYPVMQSIDNPNYYLKHSFEKDYTNYGVPYVDEACAVGLSMNTVIYGHNMKNGSMFNTLANYESKSYFEEHPIIIFDTLHSSGQYHVIATFSFDTNNETFFYNEYIDMSEEEFDDFLAQCIARRAYDTGFTAEYGDTFITLSTCDNSYSNGRFVVVAKLIT